MLNIVVNSNKFLMPMKNVPIIFALILSFSSYSQQSTTGPNKLYPILFNYARDLYPEYVKIPFERKASSLQPVHTRWPFLATTVAVPVSWQKGSSNWAAISAFRSMARATPRSLGVASGSERILATISLCFGRSKKETSRRA